MIPVSAPPRVRTWLRQTPDGPVDVLHHGPHAVYVDIDGRCVGVVDAGAAQVPCALRTRLGELAPLTGGPAYVESGILHLFGAPLVVGRIHDVTVPRIDPFHGTARDGARALAGVDEAPLDAAGVARLVGAGDGLTPYGDDVLCGWLAAHRAARIATPEVDDAVRAHAHRTTLLSATLLDCALHGEVLPPFAAWIGGLGTPGQADRTATLLAVGHTSGAGLEYGARWALQQLCAVGAGA